VLGQTARPDGDWEDNIRGSLPWLQMGSARLTGRLSQLFRRYDLVMINPIEPFTWLSYGTTINRGMEVRVTTRGKH